MKNSEFEKFYFLTATISPKCSQTIICWNTIYIKFHIWLLRKTHSVPAIWRLHYLYPITETLSIAHRQKQSTDMPLHSGVLWGDGVWLHLEAPPAVGGDGGGRGCNVWGNWQNRERPLWVRHLCSFLVKMKEVSGGWVRQRRAKGIFIYCLQNPAQWPGYCEHRSCLISERENLHYLQLLEMLFFLSFWPPPPPVFVLSPVGISTIQTLEFIKPSLWPQRFFFKLSISFCNVFSWLDMHSNSRDVFFLIYVFNIQIFQ